MKLVKYYLQFDITDKSIVENLSSELTNLVLTNSWSSDIDG